MPDHTGPQVPIEGEDDISKALGERPPEHAHRDPGDENDKAEQPHFYPQDIREVCFGVRKVLLETGEVVKHVKEHPVFVEPEGSEGQHGEMKANIMLAYRHLEDARMRLGKVVQAYDGGKSVYPQ